MPYQLDPQVQQVMGPMLELKASSPAPALYDVQARRKANESLTAHLNTLSIAADVTTTDYYTKTDDGYNLMMRWFVKKGAPTSPGPAICHSHGGGMIMGSVADFSVPISYYVSVTGTPILSIDYRVAPEHPFPTLTEDVYTGLLWLRDHAAELNVDPKRIAMMGESAGGGVAAGVVLMARDRNFTPPLAKQILFYPMLDDRNTVPDEQLKPFAFWGYDDNLTAWAALLGKGVVGTNKVSDYAAPARTKSVHGLPPTYLDVGTLDIFRDEGIKYATRLIQDRIYTELHVYPGVPHAFDAFTPDANVTQRALANRYRALTTF